MPEVPSPHDCFKSQEDRFQRVNLKCQKCGSLEMEERHIKEMWHGNRRAVDPPLYGAANEMVVTCFQCGEVVWRKGKASKDAGKLAEATACGPVKEGKKAAK